MQFLAAFIMQGRMQAIMVASAFALLSLVLPPVSIISSAAVALVTLRQGYQQGLWIVGIGSIVTALLSTVLMGNYQFGLLYGLVLWCPLLLIALLLRVTRDLALAIESAALMAMIAVLLVYGFQADVAGFWRQVLDMMMQGMLAASADMSADSMKESADLFAHYMTGGVAAGSVFGLLFGLFLARGWQASLYNPGGFIQEYRSLNPHKSLAIATLGMALVAAFSSGLLAEVSFNLLMVMFALYTIVGASFLHNAFSGLKTSRLMVPFLYLTLLMIPHVMALVALWGVLATALNLRQRIHFNGNKSS